nr:hypothetical protein [Mycoplasmopsis bovis]
MSIICLYSQVYVALSRGTKEDIRESIQKAFEKEELKPYYDFIWENIKLDW